MPIYTQSIREKQYESLTALVVDDHFPILQIMKSMLLKIGFKKVFTVKNGADALVVTENHHIDLITSDWNMPKMNGLELLKATRNHVATANIPFIMLTAHINQGDVKEAVISGVSEYLTKPFNIHLLKTKISRAFLSPVPKRVFTEAPTKASPDLEEPAIAVKGKPKNSILIVDDEPNNITVLTELLKDTYSLQACLSGAKALEICSQELLPDLILLDIMMPKMDGLAVCTQLKDNPLTEHIPIIFISALAESKDVVKGLSLGAVDYITKPIAPEITLARIHTHMKQVHQREEMSAQLDTMIENIRLKEDIERITHHDLKNPLSVIISAADTLKQQQSYSQKEIELITESAYAIQEMIDEQMLIHQLENDSTEREMDKLNALALFNKVVYGQKEKFTVNNVLVNYQINNAIHFLGNELLCFNMFNNLLANAIEASPANGEVSIVLENDGSNVVFHINNQGLIPEQIQARFFDKFITHGKEQGTGLGTYSAKLSALAQGGDIRFSSTVEKGTTLTVTLKVA